MTCFEEFLEWFGEFLEEVARGLVGLFAGFGAAGFLEGDRMGVAEDYEDFLGWHFGVDQGIY